MNYSIRKYDPSSDYLPLREIIRSEGEEWKDYLKPDYEKALSASITYVALAEGQICGYSRSISDNGLFIWVIDLLVLKNYRGHSMGRALMECIKKDHQGLDVYVLSDVDEYYEKLGYKKEGSVFRVV